MLLSGCLCKVPTQLHSPGGPLVVGAGYPGHSGRGRGIRSEIRVWCLVLHCSHAFTSNNGLARAAAWGFSGVAPVQVATGAETHQKACRKLESCWWRIMEQAVLSEIHETQRQTTSIEAIDLGIVTPFHDAAPPVPHEE